MPTLVLLKGHPGCGKTSLARALATRLRWPHIDKDDARDALELHATEHTSSIDWNQLSYDIMFNYVESQLRVGLSVIVDCPLARRELFDKAAELAAKYDAKIQLVEAATLNGSEWEKRLLARRKEALSSHHKPGSISEVLKLVEHYNGSERWPERLGQHSAHTCHVEIDTTQPMNEQVDAVLAALLKCEIQKSE